MLPLVNSLTGDDPLSKIEDILALRQCWYCQVFLILSNIPYVFPIYVLARLDFFMFSFSVFVAMSYSIAYHICQSVGYCFLSNLVWWTILDHISAPAMMAMFIVFTVNTRSVDMIRATHRMILRKMKSGGGNSYKPGLTLGSYGGFDRDRKDVSLDIDGGGDDNYNYYYSHLYVEEIAIYDGWSSAIIYCYLFVVVLSTMYHPFSMQSFIIAISFGLGVIFLKVIVIDDGDVTNTAKRVSFPELITGVILIAISLVFFVLDGIFPPQYWIFHTLWHSLSSVGVGFYALGLTKNTPNWFPLCEPIKEKTRRIFRVHARAKSFKN